MKVFYEDNHKVIDGIEYKKCKWDCNDWYPMTEEYFHKNKSNKTDGFHSYCKVCTRRKSLDYRNTHLEQARATTYKHYIDNKEKYVESRNQWMSDNKERYREYYKGFQKENAAYFSKYNKERMQNKTHEISDQEWLDCLRYFNYECAYCGINETEAKSLHKKKLHKEHVNSEGSNDLSNAAPACTPCNSSKWAHPMEEWYRSRMFFEEEKLNKIYRWLNRDYKQYKVK